MALAAVLEILNDGHWCLQNLFLYCKQSFKKAKRFSNTYFFSFLIWSIDSNQHVKKNMLPDIYCRIYTFGKEWLHCLYRRRNILRKRRKYKENEEKNTVETFPASNPVFHVLCSDAGGRGWDTQPQELVIRKRRLKLHFNTPRFHLYLLSFFSSLLFMDSLQLHFKYMLPNHQLYKQNFQSLATALKKQF